MKNSGAFVSILCAALLLLSCNSSKSLSKKALKLDEAGLYQESANMYYQSLVKNQRNVDAQIGLKKNGQKVLDDYLSDFFKAVTLNDREKAVNTFLQARNYREKVNGVGVSLEIPDHYYDDFRRIKGEFVSTLYDSGMALMEEEDFDDAEKLFVRVLELEPDFRDAERQRDLAYMEPRYREAAIANGAKRYRYAYDLYTQVLKRDPGYKDSEKLRESALQAGTIRLAVLPFENLVPDPSIGAKVTAHLTTSLAQLDDPFLKIVDRENMDRILEEQKLNMSGVMDEATAVNVGQLMGAQMLLMGSVIEYRPQAGRRQKELKKGFESYKVKRLDPDTEKVYYDTKYKAVNYYEYNQRNEVYLSASYKLVSLVTGEVLKTSVVDDVRHDEINYATYSGDKKNLFPSSDGKVLSSYSAQRNLRNQLSARTQVKSIGVLANNLYDAVTDRIAFQVDDHLQEFGK